VGVVGNAIVYPYAPLTIAPLNQVMATLFTAGHNSFAQTLEGCRKQTNIPAHIQIKRSKSEYA
jgi:hypothetical protein